MKHCEVCKADFDETNAEEAAKHEHAHPKKGEQQQQSGGAQDEGQQQGQQ